MYMRSALSIIKPHLKSLLTEAAWTQQLVNQGPTLSISEDIPPPWGQSRHPSMPGDPPHGASSLSNSDQHVEGSLETIKVAEGLGNESLESSQTVDEALKGLLRLGWLMLCQARLAEAWHASLGHAQQALLTCSFEVSVVDISGSADFGICSGGRIYCLPLYGSSQSFWPQRCVQLQYHIQTPHTSKKRLMRD